MIITQSQVDYIRSLLSKLHEDASDDSILELSKLDASEMIQDLEYKLYMRRWDNDEFKNRCISNYEKAF